MSKTTESLLPVKLTPALKIGLTVLGFLFFVLILSTLLSRKGTGPVVVDVTPSPSAVTFTSTPAREVSEFAKTADFMSFENDLNQLKTDNSTVNLTEAELTFPLLDMQVNFNKN